MKSSSTVQVLDYTWRTNGFDSWKPGATALNSTDQMLSFNNFPLDTDSDDGSEWMLIQSRDQCVPGIANFHIYRGQFTTQTPVTHTWLPAPTAASVSEMNSAGTTAIARVAPTNPAFSLGTAMGEFAGDGLPAVVGGSLVKDRVKAARSAGSEYLNVEFGWLPLVRDLQSFAKTVKASDHILTQYRKDSGNKIRRRYYFPQTTNTQVTYAGNFLPLPTRVNAFGTGHMTETTFSQMWFSGAFKYHIPTGEDTVSKFKRWSSMADHLLGVKPSPEVVWNIAPWSWAADWFANTGDIMTNISNLGKDGLVMQYGYMMSTRRRDATISATFNGVNTTRNISNVYKQRTHATPYGFGTNFASLSAKQVAVLSALGLSRF